MEARLKRLDEVSFAGDVNELRVLLDEDQLLLDRVFTNTSSKDNPLHVAAHLGHAAFTRKIVQLKPELARQLNEEGQSPLHLAVAHGHISVVKELLLLEASFDLRGIQENRNGLTPIHVAVNKGSMVMIEDLATNASEAAISMPTYKGETLLHLSVKANCLDAVKYFSETHKDKLNATDHDGNTALHLAMTAGQLPVVTHLLSCEGITDCINQRNNLGVTPLDVLSLSSHDKSIILTVAEMIRKRDGKHGEELRGPSSPLTTISTSRHSTSNRSKRKKRTHSILSGADHHGDAGILIVVATLVATITFQAGLNPPGGTIQLPYEKGDTYVTHQENYYNSTTWLYDWNNAYPAGLPVLLWSLGSFFVLDSIALLLSVSIILLLLSGVPQKNMFMMKLLVLAMWFAVFCTLLAFLSVLNDLLMGIIDCPIIDNDTQNYVKMWHSALLYVWFGIFGGGSLWISIRIIIFLLKDASLFKRKEPKWITKIMELMKTIKTAIWPSKVVCVILIICVVGILVLANFGMLHWMDFILYD